MESYISRVFSHLQLTYISILAVPIDLVPACVAESFGIWGEISCLQSSWLADHDYVESPSSFIYPCGLSFVIECLLAFLTNNLWNRNTEQNWPMWRDQWRSHNGQAVWLVLMPYNEELHADTDRGWYLKGAFSEEEGGSRLQIWHCCLDWQYW